MRNGGGEGRGVGWKGREGKERMGSRLGRLYPSVAPRLHWVPPSLPICIFTHPPLNELVSTHDIHVPQDSKTLHVFWQ